MTCVRRSSRASFHLPRRLCDGGYNPRVGAAAADVAFHEADDLFFAGTGILAEQGDARHDYARRAVAALQGVMIENRLLQWVQSPVAFQSLYRRDRLARHRA